MTGGASGGIPISHHRIQRKTKTKMEPLVEQQAAPSPSSPRRGEGDELLRGQSDRKDVVCFTSPLGERSAAGRVRGKGPSLIAAVIWIGAAALLVFCPPSARPTTPAPAHTPPRILAHYMPWYMAKPHSQSWGWHWTMGTFDPEGQPTAGRRLPRIIIRSSGRTIPAIPTSLSIMLS